MSLSLRTSGFLSRLSGLGFNCAKTFKSRETVGLISSNARGNQFASIVPVLPYRSYSSSSKTMNATASTGAAAPQPKENVEAQQKGSVTAENAEPETGQVFFHSKYNMYVCWHPEVPFPYEMTRPIDLNAPVTDSHLKIQALTPVKEAFRPKHRRMIISELIKLTYSTKHRFFGLHGKKKRTVLQSMDPLKQKRYRPYL